MKKTLSILLSICIVVLSATTISMSSLAADTNSTVKSKMIDSATYISKDVESYTYLNSYDFMILLMSGKDMTSYYNDFKSSIKTDLESNGALTATDDTNLNIYGATILCLNYMGEDATNFYGYNLVDAFSNINVTADNTSSPYNAYVAIKTAELYSLNEKSKAIADFALKNYTMDRGYDYWGISCDNTGIFAAALNPIKAVYQSYFDNAVSSVSMFKTTGGYFSNSTYGKDANADSTAMALCAYSVAGDIDKANSAYDDLKSFESANGVFTYFGTDSAYATRDALLAMEFYTEFINTKDPQSPPSSSQPTSTPAPSTTVVATTLPATATTTTTKATYKTPKKTSIKKVTKGKKQFKVTYKKVSGATGYEIQYSTSKKFTKKTTKTVTVKGAKNTSKTIKKLKGNKKYYVRVRTYKTYKSGKKTITKRSAWTSAKTVTTKK